MVIPRRPGCKGDSPPRAGKRTFAASGFTSCFSAASAKPRLDVVVRDAIDAGRFPGPRLRAATQEMTPSGNLGDLDTIDMSIPPQRRFAVTCDSPGAFRAACRIAAHATSAGSVKLCVKHGVDVIYHGALADSAAIDALETVKDRVFVVPAMGFPYALLHDAHRYGVEHSATARRRLEAEVAGHIRVMREMHARGIRVLPGGDYGIFCTPQGTNARDLALFVKVLGFTPMEAIVAATWHGGALMGLPDELGQVRAGFLADLLLVDGDPLADIALLQDAGRLAAIMKGGAFHKRPAP